MQTLVDGTGLHEEAVRAKGLRKVTLAQAQRLLREVSFAVEKRVKMEMPVDTGRARASWGHWTPGDIHGVPVRHGPRRRGAAGAADTRASNADAVYEESEDGLTITQGSNVPYIEFLNNGHSRQAPAGFLDRAQLTGQIELEKAVGTIDPLDPNLGWLNFA